MSTKPKKRTKANAPLTPAERKVLRSLMKRELGDVRIETPRSAGTRTQKASTNALFKNKKRISAEDGERVYIRLKKASPAAQERVKKLVDSGDYIYERTDDDVVVYRYADGSRFQRKPALIGEMTNGMLYAAIVRSACEREWQTHFEALAELAFRYKSADLPEGQARQIYQQTIAYLNLRIARRGGPGEVEIGQAIQRLNTQQRGSPIFLPTRH